MTGCLAAMFARMYVHGTGSQSRLTRLSSHQYLQSLTFVTMNGKTLRKNLSKRFSRTLHSSVANLRELKGISGFWSRIKGLSRICGINCLNQDLRAGFSEYRG